MTARVVLAGGRPTVAVDDPVSLRIIGVQAASSVAVQATARCGGEVWTSQARFTAGPDGLIDSARTAPTAGTYEGVDGEGLWWSMEPDDPDGWRRLPGRTLDALDVTVSVITEDGSTSSAELRRVVLGPDVDRVEVSDGGLIGTYFRPCGGGPWPGVVVLGGSEGGLVESFAAALSRHGFATLVLAYFAAPGLPHRLCRIPVEYVQQAIAWMARRPEADASRIAIAGASKGGELALLTAVHEPSLRAVVAVVPSGVAFMGIGPSPLTVRRSSWTKNGVPVPFAPFRFTRRTVGHFLSRGPLRFRVIYEEALRPPGVASRAAIPVERIAAPVLLVSAGDDQIWPSAELAHQVEERLESAGRTVRHLCFPAAGHAIGLPRLPAVTSIPRAFAGRTLLLGGTRAANASAATTAWQEAVAFLQETLQ